MWAVWDKFEMKFEMKFSILRNKLTLIFIVIIIIIKKVIIQNKIFLPFQEQTTFLLILRGEKNNLIHFWMQTSRVQFRIKSVNLKQ